MSEYERQSRDLAYEPKAPGNGSESGSQSDKRPEEMSARSSRPGAG